MNLAKFAPGSGCGCALVILILNTLIGGLATRYCFNFWGAVILHHPVHAPFWPCALLGVFIGQFTIPLAVFTWVLGFVWVPKIALLVFKWM